MKKIYVLLFVLAAFNFSINAQLKMDSGGNVAIHENPTPNNYTKLRIIQSTLNHTSNHNFALLVNNEPLLVSRWNIGIRGQSYYGSPQSISRNFGVMGRAGNASNGWNYGVFGRLIGSNNGAGVFGAMSGRSDMNTGGNYAGFFNGHVRITDNLTINGNIAWNVAYAVTTISDTVFYDHLARISDQRIKKDIVPVTNAYSKLFQLNAVEYYYKTKQELIAEGLATPEVVNISTCDTTVIDSTQITGTGNVIIPRKQYGFIAQDLQLIFPELVYEKSDGILGVDYVAFIALIIETLKEQNDKIIDLETQVANCCKTSLNEQQLKMGTNESTGTSENSEKLLQTARLFQNTPNPFTKETRIKCYIPETSANAFISVYNLQGTQMLRRQIYDKGEASISINGYELAAGMYLYALIVDGKEIDVKRMVLTD